MPAWHGFAVSPMADLPAGAAFGTLVHEVLEKVDFAAPDLREHLVQQCAAAGSDRFLGRPGYRARRRAPAVARDAARTAGRGSPAQSTCTWSDRLSELDFELPLCGGDTPRGHATVAQIAALLRRHLADDDPLAGYAADLDAPMLASRRLRGFLAGSIDAVLRVRGGTAAMVSRAI